MRFQYRILDRIQRKYTFITEKNGRDKEDVFGGESGLFVVNTK
jgi:hypothetical protein